MAKRQSLLDEVKNSLTVRHGFLPWHEQLDARLRAEVDAVKASFHAGELDTKKTTLARRLAAVLASRGVQIGFQGVLRWLEKQP